MGPSPLSVPVFQILLSLLDGEMHGYAIIKDVAERTDGEVQLTASTLYAALKRMLDGELIDEIDERPAKELDDARRRYYRITTRGNQVAREEAGRLERAVRMARNKHLLPNRRTAGS